MVGVSSRGSHWPRDMLGLRGKDCSRQTALPCPPRVSQTTAELFSQWLFLTS